MKAKRKNFEFYAYVYAESVDVEVNEEESTIELSYDIGTQFDSKRHINKYEYRKLASAKLEVRLLESRNEVLGGNYEWEVKEWEVKDGTLREPEIKKCHESLSDEKIQELTKEVEWHQQQSEVWLLCVFNGDKKAIEEIKNRIRAKIKTLEEAERAIIIELRDDFGDQLVVNDNFILNSDRISFPESIKSRLQDWFSSRKSSEYGLQNWDEFMGGWFWRRHYQQLLDEGPKLVSADAWTEETVEKEITEWISEAFPKHDANHCLDFLDGPYLKKQLNSWVREAIREEEVDCGFGFFKKYRNFLRDVDSSLGSSISKKDFGLERVNFPDAVEIDGLSQPVGIYLKNRRWQNDYMDWVLIAAFVLGEASSFSRGIENVKGQFTGISRFFYRDKFEALNRLAIAYSQLCATVSSLTYSANELLNNSRLAASQGCTVHPCVFALLENRISNGEKFVTFPPEAQTPKSIEAHNVKRKKNKAA